MFDALMTPFCPAQYIAPPFLTLSPYIPEALPFTKFILFNVTLFAVMLNILEYPSASRVKPLPFIVIGLVMFMQEVSGKVTVAWSSLAVNIYDLVKLSTPPL